MNDADIMGRIDELVQEEHRLYQRRTGGEAMTAVDDARLESLEVARDQCWDLLRQRRARRHAGADPEQAHARPGEVVEHYQQ